jgi:hypothetical protein
MSLDYLRPGSRSLTPYIVGALIATVLIGVAGYFLFRSLTNINADLCHFYPRRADKSILSQEPVSELRSYARKLESGALAFNLNITGQNAASQLRYGQRFASFYNEVIEEVRTRPSLSLTEVVEMFDRIRTQEAAIDSIEPGDLRYSATIYLRSFQQGECSFPYIFKDLPRGSVVYDEVKRAYPAFNGLLLYSGNMVKFAQIYDDTTAAAKNHVNHHGSVSAIKLGQLLRTAILSARPN